MNVKKTNRPKIILLILLALCAGPSSASAFLLLDYSDPWAGCVPGHYCGDNDIKWVPGSTVDYKFHETITAEHSAMIQEAFNLWWDSGIDLYFNLDPDIVTGYDNPSWEFDPWTGGVIRQPTWTYGTVFYFVNDPLEFSYSAVGLTSTLESSDGTLLAAPIYLNSDYFTAHSDPLLFFNTVLHEIGHFLGLGHSNYPNTVMDPYLVMDHKLSLSSDDIAGVQYLYGLRNSGAPAVPEPSAFLLLGAGLFGLAFGRKR